MAKIIKNAFVIYYSSRLISKKKRRKLFSE
jgi:hypothetical protein